MLSVADRWRAFNVWSCCGNWMLSVADRWRAFNVWSCCGNWMLAVADRGRAFNVRSCCGNWMLAVADRGRAFSVRSCCGNWMLAVADRGRVICAIIYLNASRNVSIYLVRQARHTFSFLETLNFSWTMCYSLLLNLNSRNFTFLLGVVQFSVGHFFLYFGIILDILHVEQIILFLAIVNSSYLFQRTLFWSKKCTYFLLVVHVLFSS